MYIELLVVFLLYTWLNAFHVISWSIVIFLLNFFFAIQLRKNVGKSKTCGIGYLCVESKYKYEGHRIQLQIFVNPPQFSTLVYTDPWRLYLNLLGITQPNVYWRRYNVTELEGLVALALPGPHRSTNFLCFLSFRTIFYTFVFDLHTLVHPASSSISSLFDLWYRYML